MTDPTVVTQWELDCRAELMVNHENEVFLKFVLLAEILGYVCASLGHEIPTSIVHPSFSYFSNFSEDWHEKFISRHPKLHGSRTAYGKRINDPQFLKSSAWMRADFFEEAAESGIAFQHLEIIKGKFGTTTFFGLAGSTQASTAEILQNIKILTKITAEQIAHLLQKKHLPQADCTLTEREILYLRMALDGKSGNEIADLMGISFASSNYLQRSLPDRLDRKGIVATAVLAHQIGLLSTDIKY